MKSALQYEIAFNLTVGVDGEAMGARYPVISMEESQVVRSEIRRIFLEVWDPIRVNDEPNAQDEYDSYIGRAFELLTTDGSDKEIIGYLLWITDRMGMDGSVVSLQTVTAALRSMEWKD